LVKAVDGDQQHMLDCVPAMVVARMVVVMAPFAGGMGPDRDRDSDRDRARQTGREGGNS
jgi:hypothetical protein